MDQKTLTTVVKLVVCLAGLIYTIYHTRPIVKGECPANFSFVPKLLNRESFERPYVHRGECFFPKDYEDGASNFVSAALSAGAEVSSMPVGENGLKTDVAILRKGADPKRFIVHLSGVHGPEGYVGSAIQSAALKYIQTNGLYQDSGELADGVVEVDLGLEGDNVAVRDAPQKLLPTLVFVHAVNPFGFKHHRRVNEDNVDLNRNFLSEEEWEQVMALDPNYARHIDFQEFINPTSRPFPYIWMNELFTTAQSAYLMMQFGMQAIKTALVSGNYRNPTGYSYGGQQHTQSVKNLINLLINELDIPNKAEKLVMIDVHSGLGPSGVDTLLDLGYSSEEVEALFPTEFNPKGEAIGGLKSTAGGSSSGSEGQKESSSAADEVSKGYEMVKGTTNGNFCNNIVAPRLGSQDKFCITQEFGTLDTRTVGMTLVAENYAYHHGTEEEKAYYANKLKGCFYVEDKMWKRRTIHRGMMLLLQALDHLSA